MNQIVDVEALVSAVPLDKPATKAMTRAEKLLRWADIVRDRGAVRIYHGLEYYSKDLLQQPIAYAAHSGFEPSDLFGIAASDPVLREQGLTGTPQTGAPDVSTVSTQQIMDFFSLTQEQLHAFSCDCGGQLTGRDIAGRIEQIAATP